jgi:N-acyl homoserine lactone hydrolase
VHQGDKKVVGKILAFVLLALCCAPAKLRAVEPLQTAVSLWRLDCGRFMFPEFSVFFSDTLAYPPGPKTLTNSCYLIRDGKRLMLWDTGLTDELIGHPSVNPVSTRSLAKSLVAQLAEIRIEPRQIEFIGISHNHSDHIGQAARFPRATLLIGSADWHALIASPTKEGLEPGLLLPWARGERVEALTGDRDVFADGKVIMIKTPGHTDGHYSLLVRLKTGPVLLSGDLYHFREQVAIDGVPSFNENRADTLASMDRAKKIAKNLSAKLVIQHDPRDIDLLPRFPRAAQ